MQRSRGNPPLWERQVLQTVRGIRSRTDRRSLKSSDVYECLCLFIADQLKNRTFSYESIRNHYRHLSLFARWLQQSHPRLSIAAVDAPCIRQYFAYLECDKHYKRFSLQIVQVALKRFFHSLQLRRLIRTNPVGEFRIRVRNKEAVRTLPSPFELMRLLASVRGHYQWLRGRQKAHRFSLFIHRRDLCIFSLCVACGLRRSELVRIRIADVDFERFTIRVAGKGAGRFTIRERLAFFSHPFLQQVLHRYGKMREALPGSCFFCNWLGDPLAGRSIDDIFMTYSSFLHPPAPLNPTVLRKAFCTHLAQRKVAINAIQLLMGHEKCETTLHYYVQLSPEQLEQTWKETNPYAHRV
ncbi:MAG: tyrosine-type recombinase/integrase [Spirochaetes bacterium]|nr:tyrosine-type recombinase/integrase [Spirochaetota bacterium]